MAERPTVRSTFEKLDGQRSGLMDLARQCSALTIPSLLPPDGHTQNTPLPVAWTNTGGEGLENMVGKLLTSLFPVGVQWFTFSLDPKTERSLTAEGLTAMLAALNIRERIVSSALEKTNYRIAIRAALESLLGVGNCLLMWNSRDHDLRYYRLDQWVCRRSGGGKVLEIVTREPKFPMELTDAERESAKIKADDEEPHDLYTSCRWQDGHWHFRQEMEGATLLETTHPRCPYLAAAYRLCPGEHQAHGFIAGRLPDLKSVNKLWESLIFGMANAAKMLWGIDPSEPNVRPEDLLKPNGQIVTARIDDAGRWKGVACLQTNKISDFQMAFNGAIEMEKRLGRSMLMETASMPKGERVTATAVLTITREMEGALGGPYAHIADQIQKPLLEFFIGLLEQDAVLVPINEHGQAAVRLDILTGPAALSRQMELDKLLTGVQNIAALPGELERMDTDAVASEILHLGGVDASRFWKSDDQLNADMARRSQEVLQEEAAKGAAKTIGALVEQRGSQAAPAA